MGDMDNNQNDGNGLDTSQVTTNSGEPVDITPTESTSQSTEKETEQFTFVEAPYEQSFETAPDSPHGKKQKPKFIAAILIIAVLLVVSVLAYTNRNTFSNSIALMSKSPLEYYSGIEKQYVNKGIDSFTDSYDKYLDLYQKQKTSGIAQDTDVKLTINPQFTSMIGLSDFQSIEAKITSLSKDNNGKSIIGFSYNDQPLVTLNTLINSETSELFVNVPELSSAYLLFSLDELMSYSGETDNGSNYSEYMKEIEALLNDESVSPETLNSILKKYSDLIIDHIDNMKLDKNISISASKLNGTYNMLTSELNGNDIYDIATAVLNEAKTDETVKNLLVTLNVCTADEYSQLVEDAITDLDNSKEDLTSDEDSILMHVYADKSGRIMGREFTSADEGNASGAGYYLATKGDKVGFTAWVKDNGKNVVEFTSDGSYSADGFTGTSVLNYSEYNAEYDDDTNYSFDIAIENAKILKDNGHMNGKFTVTSDLLMGAELVLDCNADEQQQNVKFQVLYGGVDAATMDITSKKRTYEAFEFPSSADEVYDGMNDFYSYMGSADFEGFLASVEDVTGLDLNSLFQSFLYNSMY
ncbi:MAG: hypothetical protein WCD89_16680 [Anaerocolumna sp.]